MNRTWRWSVTLVVVGGLATACGVNRATLDMAEPVPTLFPPDTTVVSDGDNVPTTAAPVTTTTRVLPTLPTDGSARAVTTPTGVVAAVVSGRPGGPYVVLSPCGKEVTVPAATPIVGAHVVLDPGHGGSESGAVGPTGLKESDLNLAVAREVERQLEVAGVQVVLTRTADYRIALAGRAQIAGALRAAAFVSIHHNAEPDHTQDTPGTEIYFQADDERSSKRLAGLVYEETVDALAAYRITWGAFRDAGVKVRLNARGEDYYGILRGAAGTPSALAELAYLTNAPEEALLKTPEFRAAEATAVARGILRYLITDDAGRGFVEPSDRTEPAGPGGGSQGCVDPPL